MNKTVIPTIVGLTILVAGVFAMAPVEDASAVHTTLQTTIGTLQVVTDSQLVNWDAGEALTWACTGNTIIHAVPFDLTDGANTPQADNSIDFTYDRDAGGNLPAVTLLADIFGGNAPADNGDLLSLVTVVGEAKQLTLTTGGTVTVNLQAEPGTGDIQTGTAALVATSTGTCSAT